MILVLRWTLWTVRPACTPRDSPVRTPPTNPTEHCCCTGLMEFNRRIGGRGSSQSYPFVLLTVNAGIFVASGMGALDSRRGVMVGSVMTRCSSCMTVGPRRSFRPVSYTHLRAHETVLDLVCRLLLEKKNMRHIIR